MARDRGGMERKSMVSVSAEHAVVQCNKTDI
jgi:hypothetical protein